MASAWRVPILLLAVVFACAQAQYTTRRSQMCHLDQQPIVLLSRDATSGEFTVIKTLEPGTEELEEGSFRRGLTFEDLDGWRQDGGSDSAQPLVGANLRSGAREQTDALQLPAFFDETEGGGVVEPGLMVTLASEGQQEPLTQAGLEGFDIDMRSMKEDENGNQLFYARECDCFNNDGYPTVYCPFTTATCHEPSRSSGLPYPGCLRYEESNSNNRNRFLYILALYPAITMCILLTSCGRYCLSFLISWIPGWNDFHVNHLMENDRSQARSLIRNYVVRNQRVLENRIRRERRREERLARQNAAINGTEATSNANANANAPTEAPDQPKPRPTGLTLRTSIYRKAHKKPGRRLSTGSSYSHRSEDDEDKEMTCTICFVPLEDGDRVGLLPCSHKFHKECLKQWLQRRNVCPLCQHQDVAAPRYDDVVEDKKDEDKKEESDDATERYSRYDSNATSSNLSAAV